MAVSKRLRYEILRRDQHTCRYCGAAAPDVPLRVDHVVPVALGGTDEPTNLVTACQDCNSGKSSASADHTLVADVADDALRWAAAMQQAATDAAARQGERDRYRSTFQSAWNEWTYEHKGERHTFELPLDWKKSLEQFRQAGLPAEVLPEIVETTMTAKSVRSDNLFRYCCGVAWRMIDELQEAARQIVGASDVEGAVDSRASVLDAAFTVWQCGMSEGDDAPSAQQAEDFRRSLDALTGWGLTEPGRIVEAAQHAAWFSICDIAEAMKDLDRSRIWSAWISAWPQTYIPSETGDPWDGRSVGGPSDEVMERVKATIRKLVDGQVPVFRAVLAATHAGFHKSSRIYRGLTDEEVAVSGEYPWIASAAELWRVAFTASGEREPSPKETAQFFDCLKRIGDDGAYYVADADEAAVLAGAYQDPDLSSCLLRHRSVFEAAATPLSAA